MIRYRYIDFFSSFLFNFSFNKIVTEILVINIFRKFLRYTLTLYFDLSSIEIKCNNSGIYF